MGDRFEDKAAAAYTKLVKEYPLSPRVEAARKKLEAMNRPVPESDPVAYARMKYDLENRNMPGKVGRLLDTFKRAPDISASAKGGTPAMTMLRPGVPVSVPQPAGGGNVFGRDGHSQRRRIKRRFGRSGRQYQGTRFAPGRPSESARGVHTTGGGRCGSRPTGRTGDSRGLAAAALRHQSSANRQGKEKSFEDDAGEG